MSAPSFTPGPWCVFPGYNPGIEAPSGTIVTFGDHGESCGIRGPNKEADARLIAAAPELLEALKRMLVAFNRTGRKLTTIDGSPTATDLAIEAIDKAEGREP